MQKYLQIKMVIIIYHKIKRKSKTSSKFRQKVKTSLEFWRIFKTSLAIFKNFFKTSENQKLLYKKRKI